MSGSSVVIDWSAPWLEPWALTGRQVDQGLRSGLLLQEALNSVLTASLDGRWIPGQAADGGVHRAGAANPIRFVAQQDMPAGMAYEQFVFETRRCPVRPGLHDFFNGLCWLRFPQSKARLNALQAGEIARSGVQPVRGPLRDALTLFDENAALLDAPQALWDALTAKHWQRLFIDLRPLWQQARLLLFGHALLEKLATPRRAVTAHVWQIAPGVAAQGLEALDAWLARDLTPDKLTRKPFAALPVLGVPGWCSANEDAAFYQDAAVFRPAAQSRKGHVPSDTKA